MKQICFSAVLAVAFAYTNNAAGVSVTRWPFWAYLAIILAFSIINDSRWRK